MSLNVREIEAHEFAMVKRGYDPDEVRSYLRKIATSVKDAPGRAYGDVGDRVASVFESADKAAAEITEAAEREADALRREIDAYVKEQRERADEALREAEAEAVAKLADADAHH
ncbi:MAG: DivIVA domain-containing protein [Acidimicrobiales bacterium]